jgi:hypothetical protein
MYYKPSKKYSFRDTIPLRKLPGKMHVIMTITGRIAESTNLYTTYTVEHFYRIYHI